MLRRAGLFLVAVMVGGAAGAMVLAGPAAAGGWAATVIDPAGTIEAGKAHQVSFWVLQHGTHPYNWSQPASIGAVALTVSDDQGSRVTFTGQQLPEPGHYVTMVTVPHAGRWKVTSIQGIFGGYHVGALTVPGSFEQLGVPAAPSTQDLRQYWPGKVQPPVLAVDNNRDPFVNDEANLETVAEPAPVDAPAAAGEGSGGVAANRPEQLTWLFAGGLLVLLVALGLGRRWWVRRGVAQT